MTYVPLFDDAGLALRWPRIAAIATGTAGLTSPQRARHYADLTAEVYSILGARYPVPFEDTTAFPDGPPPEVLAAGYKILAATFLAACGKNPAEDAYAVELLEKQGRAALKALAQHQQRLTAPTDERGTAGSAAPVVVSAPRRGW